MFFFRIDLTNFKLQTFVEVEEATTQILDCADAIHPGGGGHIWHQHSFNTASAPTFNDQAQLNERGKSGTIFGSYRGQSVRRGGRPDGVQTNPPPPSCSKEKIIWIIEQWITNKEETLPLLATEPSAADKIHKRYCHYHRRVHHPTIECFSLRYIVQIKKARGVGDRKSEY